MDLKPFQPWHFEYLNGVDPDGMEHDVARLYASNYANYGYAFTVIDGGEIVGCAGVVVMWKGVAEVWALFSKQAKLANPWFLHRKSKLILDNILRDHEFHRVQAIVNLTDEQALQWIYALGFDLECIMRKYNSNQSDSGVFIRRT